MRCGLLGCAWIKGDSVSPTVLETAGEAGRERFERSGGLGGAVVTSEALGDGGRGGGSDIRGICGGTDAIRADGGDGGDGAGSEILGVGSEIRGGVDWRLGSATGAVSVGTAAALGERRTVTMLLLAIDGLVVWLR